MNAFRACIRSFFPAACLLTSVVAAEVVPQIDAEFFANPSQSGEMNGSAVSLSGQYAAVGAEGHVVGAGQDAGRGAVRILKLSEPEGGKAAQWTRIAMILNHIDDFQSSFGYEVALDGDLLAVGDTGYAEFAGVVHIYHRDSDDQWSLEASLNLDASFGAEFGRTLALSNGLLHVGMSSLPGQSHIYRRVSPGNWVLEANLSAPNPALFDGFGADVALQGNLAVAGASGNVPGVSVGGAAYVYRRTALGTWQHEATLIQPNPMPDDGFGTAVSLSGDRLVVGAPYRDDFGTASGAAYIFHRNTGNAWTFEHKFQPSDLHAVSTLGKVLDISGNRVILYGDVTGPMQGLNGKAYLYERQLTGEWIRQPDIQRPTPYPYDLYGHSMAIDSQRAIIGSPHATQFVQGDLHGAAFIYDLVDTSKPLPPAADINSDGSVNVDDLLIVINSWGACAAPPSACPADIAPASAGDGSVDVDDLLMVINGWS